MLRPYNWIWASTSDVSLEHIESHYTGWAYSDVPPIKLYHNEEIIREWTAQDAYNQLVLPFAKNHNYSDNTNIFLNCISVDAEGHVLFRLYGVIHTATSFIAFAGICQDDFYNPEMLYEFESGNTGKGMLFNLPINDGYYLKLEDDLKSLSSWQFKTGTEYSLRITEICNEEGDKIFDFPSELSQYLIQDRYDVEGSGFDIFLGTNSVIPLGKDEYLFQFTPAYYPYYDFDLDDNRVNYKLLFRIKDNTVVESWDNLTYPCSAELHKMKKIPKKLTYLNL